MAFDDEVFCAISRKDKAEYGCPACGHAGAFEAEGTAGIIWQCSACEVYYAVLHEASWQTPFAVRFRDGRFMPMSVQAHPLRVLAES